MQNLDSIMSLKKYKKATYEGRGEVNESSILPTDSREDGVSLFFRFLNISYTETWNSIPQIFRINVD